MKCSWLFLFTVFFLASCGNDNTLWKKSYGGSGWDQLNSLVSTPDGGALFGGYTTSNGSGNIDMYLVRVDPQGKMLWENSYGGLKADILESLILMPDGGALLGGYTSSSGAGGDIYIVRIDERGNKLWEKTYGGLGRDAVESLVLTPDGGALLGGYTSPGVGDEVWLKEKLKTQTVKQIMSEAGNNDMYLIRVDEQGNKLWEKRYDKSRSDVLRSLVLTPDGGALLGGSVQPSDLTSQDMYLVRVDKNGNKLWEKTYGGTDRDEIRSLALTSDGGALLAGTTTSSGAGATDMYLIRVDESGNKLWEKTYGGANHDHLTSIVITQDGGALLGGATKSSGAGNLVRIDKLGNILWEKTYGMSNSDPIYSLALTPDGGAFVGGTTIINRADKIVNIYLLRLIKA